VSKIHKSKVLVVGAGGIGCELLKNMVLSGFLDIVVVDLDTIDLSNLNRQFLFQKQHISKSKAHVARESVLKFNPEAKIHSHHGKPATLRCCCCCCSRPLHFTITLTIFF